jgi:hypothetical protein
MRITRTLHRRAPLIVRNAMASAKVGEDKNFHLKWHNVTPTIVPDRANPTGGVTVLLTGDPEDGSGLVEVQVAFCNINDPFSRRLGRVTAASKEKYVIKVTDIPRELHDIEHQMLCQVSGYMRKHHNIRNEMTRPGGWSFAMYQFLPKVKEQANG